MRCGSGSNTKGEILSLWLIGLDNINVFGDSKVIMEWATEARSINVLHLLAWLKKTLLSICSFKSISFSHIYREQNHLADNISNKALLAVEGSFFFELWHCGSLSSKGSCQTFSP